MALAWLGNVLRPTRPKLTDEADRFRDRRRNPRIAPTDAPTILVVDDSRTVRVVLQRMLLQGGYQTLEAEDGRQAVSIAKLHKPRLIIMDLVMPVMDGFQATRALRRDPQTAGIPIVIMSGNRVAIDNFWATKIGANDFMIKPFNRSDVFRRLDKALYNIEVA